MKSTRLRALFRKEILDLSRNLAALLPVAIVAIISFVLPFAIAIAVPTMTGYRLGSDADLERVSRLMVTTGPLSPDGRVQLFLFEQFLVFFLLTPTTGAMALAAHAIIGEKQARTLEPLLATPLTTFELLVAKVLGAFVPTLLISIAGLTIYFAMIAAFAEPGVMGAMLNARTFALVGLVGPGIGLVALQAAVLISSRVNDARTAQQFGVLIILPITALLVAQFTGALTLSASVMALGGLGLLLLWVILTVVSIAIFQREAILTRWR